MTTDNRTPKQTEAKSSQDFVFTEAQVEAACKAHEFTNAFGPERETRMRAALVAAAGVAPQAESDEQVHFAPYMSATAACGEAVPKGALAVKEGDRLYADTRFTDRRKETTCAECVSRAQIVEHGTVQPSSTVDVAALIREAKAEALEEFAEAQETWCARGRAEQVISRAAMRDALRARAAEYREGSET